MTLAWVLSDCTVWGGLGSHLRCRLWLRWAWSLEPGRSRGPPRLHPSMHTRRKATASGLQPHAEWREPQETHREHEACRGGKAQPPQREGPRAHGRGRDLVHEVRCNRLLLRPEPGLQDVGAEEVHVVWHPMGVLHNGLEGLLGEDRSPR